MTSVPAIPETPSGEEDGDNPVRTHQINLVYPPTFGGPDQCAMSVQSTNQTLNININEHHNNTINHFHIEELRKPNKAPTTIFTKEAPLTEEQILRRKDLEKMFEEKFLCSPKFQDPFYSSKKPMIPPKFPTGKLTNLSANANGKIVFLKDDTAFTIPIRPQHISPQHFKTRKTIDEINDAMRLVFKEGEGDDDVQKGTYVCRGYHGTWEASTKRCGFKVRVYFDGKSTDEILIVEFTRNWGPKDIVHNHFTDLKEELELGATTRQNELKKEHEEGVVMKIEKGWKLNSAIYVRTGPDAPTPTPRAMRDDEPSLEGLEINAQREESPKA